MDVTIVGGGTAGWIAAFTVLRGSQAESVTVIEPSSIGVIGAGEASSGLLLDLLTDEFTYNDDIDSNKIPAVDIQKFFNKTRGFYKYGILHRGWSKRPGDYFGPITPSWTSGLPADYAFLQAVARFGTRQAHVASELGLAYEMRKMPLNGDMAVHFDGNEFAPFMKDFLSYDPRLKVIDAPINDVELDTEGNIESVVLDDGSRVGGDLFIDATGFKRLLMKRLDVGWVSYKDVLPVDSALPFIIEHKEGGSVMPITVAQAMGSGWMWNTPLQSRRGAGYVYSSNHLTPEQAQEEIEKKLKHKIEPLGNLKFDSGKSEDFWVKNCVSLGLSSTFIEPLEATAIHTTILQMLTLVKEYFSFSKDRTINDLNRKLYNSFIHKITEEYKDFTVLHYQGGRDDTDFWRRIKNDNLITERVSDYIEKAKYSAPGGYYLNDFSTKGLWSWTLAGLDLISKDTAKGILKSLNIYTGTGTNFMRWFYDTREALNKGPGLYIVPAGRNGNYDGE